MPATSLESFRTKHGQLAYNALLKAIETKPPKPSTNRSLSMMATRLMAKPQSEVMKGKQVARVRGSSDVPLNKEGLSKADRLAGQFTAKGGLDAILTSPLQRARNTGVAIAKATGAPLQVTHALMPWKLGMFEGEPVEDVKHFIAKLANEHPEQSAPGRGPSSTDNGESFNSFKQRFIGQFLAPLMEAHAQDPRSKVAAVSHLRDVLAAKSWIENGARKDLQFDHHDVNYEQKTDKEDIPGSVFHIHPEGDKWKFDHVKMEDPSPLGAGIYLIRHGKTDWNTNDIGGTS
jgi:broad specificity phosphatase PhoE